MANLRQFNKGETIQITVTPDSGVKMDSPILYVYPDSLDLNSNPDTLKIQKIPDVSEGAYTDGSEDDNGNIRKSNDAEYVFSICPDVTGDADMPAGDYTVELKYGSSNDITVVKQNHAFTLVESGYNKKESASS